MDWWENIYITALAHSSPSNSVAYMNITLLDSGEPELSIPCHIHYTSTHTQYLLIYIYIGNEANRVSTLYSCLNSTFSQKQFYVLPDRLRMTQYYLAILVNSREIAQKRLYYIVIGSRFGRFDSVCKNYIPRLGLFRSGGILRCNSRSFRVCFVVLLLGGALFCVRVRWVLLCFIVCSAIYCLYI